MGFCMTTPYSLITSVMASDLGRHPSLRGNSSASATVTALLDGTGSAGAVVQGLAIGWVSEQFGWGATLYFLMGAAALSAICLVRPSVKELQERRERNAMQPSLQDRITLQPT